MTLYPARRLRSSFGTGRILTYGASAFIFGLAGWYVARVPDAVLVPVTAAAALAAAVIIGLIGVRHRMLTSPLILLGIPLLLSLAAAMQPITRIFGEWTLRSLTEVVLIVAAPIVGVGAAMLASPRGSSRMQRGTEAVPYPERLIAVCLVMCAAGTAVYLQEWSSVGGPPLLAANIDAARFGVEYGLLHVFTQGLPLALLIATWARVARPQSFTSAQRRVLEAIVCFVPLPLALGGGRTLVLVPVLTAAVVAARYVSPQAARRWMVVIPVAILLFSSVVFLTREHQHTGPVTGTILYGDTGTSSSLFAAAFRSLSINLGEQLRVVKELRDADITSPPFTTSIYFLHNFIPRAVDVHTISGPNAGGWLTTMYAGQLLLDFGLGGALLYGFILGAASHLLYRRFARGESVTIIWAYAYVAAPIAFSFYINVFLFFVYPILDLIVLVVLSRLLIVPANKPAPHPASVPLAATV